MQHCVWRNGLALLSALVLVACSPSQPAPAPEKAETVAAKPAAVASSSSSSASRKANDLYQPLPIPPDTVRVLIETAKGDIVLELDGKNAPISTANFLQYVDTGKLNDAEFWRAMRSGNGSGFVQMSGSGHKFPPIPHEPTSKTGLSHTNGTISTARYAVGTASNEFTISVGDMSYMDAGRDPEGDNQGYAAFGKVVSGMSVVRQVLNGKITTKSIEGGWDGQMLAEPVKIISAKRID